MEFDRAAVTKERAAGAMTGRAGSKKESIRRFARKKRLRILHFQIYSVHLHHQNGLCRDGTGESVAQQVEHNTFNVGVLGSSPSGFTKWSGSRTTAGFFVCGSLHERPVYRTKVQYTGLSLLIPTTLLFTSLWQKCYILDHDKLMGYASLHRSYKALQNFHHKQGMRENSGSSIYIRVLRNSPVVIQDRRKQ